MFRTMILACVLVLLAIVVSSCGPAPTPEVVEKIVEKEVVETVIVKETVEVEKEVAVEKEVTKIIEKEVEKVVTATPEPQPELWYKPEWIGESFIHICLDTPPRYGGTLVSAIPQNWWVQGNAFLWSEYESFVFSRLLHRLPDWSIEGDLAENWEITEDGLVYTFYLRKGVKFHDGEEVTAEDVKYSIEACTHPDSGCAAGSRYYSNLIVGASAFRDGQADEISGVKALDEYTVEITLTEPRADVIPQIAHQGIFPKHLMAEIPFDELNDSEYATMPVGSGPFKLVEFVPDQYWVLEAFEDYYAGRPYLDRIIIRAGIEKTPAWIGTLEAGEIHVGWQAVGADRQRLEGRPDVVLVGGPQPGPVGIWPNTERIDKRIVKAMVHAVDRQAIVDGIYYGNQAVVWEWKDADPLGEWVGPDTPEYPYDPEKAKQLLAEAAAEGAWDPDQELTLTSWYNREVDKSALAAMQQYWADVGLTVNVEFVDIPTFVEKVYNQADFDMAFGCCGIADPFYFVNRYDCGKNYPDGYNISRWCNPEAHELIEQAGVETDPAKRTELFYKVTEIAADDMVIAGLWAEDRRFAIRKEVCNYIWLQLTNPHPDVLPETWYLASE